MSFLRRPDLAEGQGRWMMKLCWIILVFATTITAIGIPSGAGSTAIGQTQASPGVGKVDGIVRDQLSPRAPVQYALVKLFPEPLNLEHPDMIRSARTDEHGHFVIENVAPGRYSAIAIMGTGPEDLHAEATIAGAAGTRFELSEKQSKTLTLYLYLAHH